MAETLSDLRRKGRKMMKTGRDGNCLYPEDDWANRDQRYPSAAAAMRKWQMTGITQVSL